MSQETETVSGNSETPQSETETQKEVPEEPSEIPSSQSAADSTINNNTHQPTVQEDACILKSPSSSIKSRLQEATEDFLMNERNAAYYHNNNEATTVKAAVDESAETILSRVNSKEDLNFENDHDAPQVVNISLYDNDDSVLEEEEEEEEKTKLNGHNSVIEEPEINDDKSAQLVQVERVLEINGGFNSNVIINEIMEIEKLTNGVAPFNGNGEIHLSDNDDDDDDDEKPEKVLNGTIANELVAEDYKLPDVVEVKKHFENSKISAELSTTILPPKKGALSTVLDTESIKKAYKDVRYDGSETQWAVFKFEGPTIITSATGSDFADFQAHFGDDERAFAYIRVQTGDEMSRRAKFLLITWVGPSVSVLKRAKMSTDKAIIKDILSNFAVELQSENIADINLQKFEAELDKAAGAHYGTGVSRS